MSTLGIDRDCVACWQALFLRSITDQLATITLRLENLSLIPSSIKDHMSAELEHWKIPH